MRKTLQRIKNSWLRKWYTFRKTPFIPRIDMVIQTYYDKGKHLGWKEYQARQYVGVWDRYGKARNFTYEQIREAVYNRSYSRETVVNEREFFKFFDGGFKNDLLREKIRYYSVRSLEDDFPVLFEPTPFKEKMEKFL